MRVRQTSPAHEPACFGLRNKHPTRRELAYRDHSSYRCHLLPRCDAGLYSLMHPCLFYDMPLSSLTHLMTASPLRVRHDSQVRRLQTRKELMAMIWVSNVARNYFEVHSLAATPAPSLSPPKNTRLAWAGFKGKTLWDWL